MRRREFISLLGGAAAAWPVAARAQQRTMPVIGFLGSESPSRTARLLSTFRQGLDEAGYTDGQNVAIEYLWAEGQNERLPVLAAEFVRRQVNVIAVPASTPGALAAKAATSTIPIVIFTAGDPVALGLVASLNRPGGNVTGATSLGGELAPKRLSLMHELLPKASAMALLVNPSNPTLAKSTASDVQAAASTLGLELRVIHASTERDFDTVFASLRQMQAGALVIAVDSFFTGHREQLGAMTLRNGIAGIYQSREFAAAGGLMSYGGNLADAYRLVGVYTGRILKGEKPAVMPVQQATRVELIINMMTAKSLGIAVPTGLLVRADEAIE